MKSCRKKPSHLLWPCLGMEGEKADPMDYEAPEANAYEFNLEVLLP
eukprot:UN18188